MADDQSTENYRTYLKLSDEIMHPELWVGKPHEDYIGAVGRVEELFLSFPPWLKRYTLQAQNSLFNWDMKSEPEHPVSDISPEPYAGTDLNNMFVIAAP
jgi:hypothetical protein